MAKYLFSAFLALFSLQAYGAGPCLYAGDFVKCLPTSGIFLENGQTLSLSTDGSTTHRVELSAPDSMAAEYVLKFPTTNGTDGQAMQLAAGTLSWYTPFSSAAFNVYKTEIPMKFGQLVASTANIDMSAGNPGIVDGVDLTFGGNILLKNQTDHSENGPWGVDIGGIWTRDSTMPDNTTSAYSAIVPINSGGTTTGNTIWYSQSNGDGNVPFVQIPTSSGNAPFTSESITGASGAGYIDLLGQGTNVATPSSGHTRIFAQNDDGLYIEGRVAGNPVTAKLTVSSIAANTTRSYTLPDASGVVTLNTATQTLTNKTLTAPSIGTSETYLANGEARFNNSGNTFYTGFKGGEAAASKIWTLPLVDGSSGQFLKTDGSATLGWASALANPMTTAGDVIYGGVVGVGTRLAAGTSAQVLHSGTTPSWSAVSLTGDVTGTLGAANGGTGVANNAASTWTISGNFGTTATVTGTTTVTLPTTGTLATLAGTETFTNKTLTSPKVNEAVALTTTATKLNYLTSATGTTGTASQNIVFDTSPTLVTPTLGVATATSVAWSDTTKGIIGTATNDAAAASYVGEYKENVRSSNLNVTTTQSSHYFDIDSGATISGATTTGATGIVLTAGCWDISANIVWNGNTATTTSILQAFIGTATADANTGRDLVRSTSEIYYPTAVTLNNLATINIQPFRVNLSGSTTYYLKGIFSGSAAGSIDVTGYIRATRVR